MWASTPRREVVEMSKLSTSAWIGHNLGLAACFGGTLFGKFA